jgi:uncharacterized protein (DUF488 family)
MTTKILPISTIKFYTTGYAAQDINDLKPMLNALDALLIDVRLFPISELMRWRQIYLKALLREKYCHIAQLGSRPDRTGVNQIQHLDLGLKILLSFHASAVLMCECADSKRCHRLVIAKELKSRGFEAEELGNWRGFMPVS